MKKNICLSLIYERYEEHGACMATIKNISLGHSVLFILSLIVNKLKQKDNKGNDVSNKKQNKNYH